MTKALVLAAAMMMAMLAPAMAQTSSPDPAPTPPAASSPAVTTPASPCAPPSVAPEAGTTTGSTTATSTLGTTTRILTVDALEDMDLVGADGKEIGDIEGVVENNADKKQFVVIERGGFLGFGAKDDRDSGGERRGAGREGDLAQHGRGAARWDDGVHQRQQRLP